jgi:prepilin-type processing-associated H-X9-DG protein
MTKTEYIKIKATSGKLKWIVDGLSKTILVCERAGRPESIIGRQRQEHVGSWVSAWIIHGGRGAIWTRRDVSDLFGFFDTEFLERPVNFSNSQQIFSFHRGGAHVSMCDGSVRFLSEDSSAEAVFAMATRNGAVLDEHDHEDWPKKPITKLRS